MALSSTHPFDSNGNPVAARDAEGNPIPAEKPAVQPMSRSMRLSAEQIAEDRKFIEKTNPDLLAAFDQAAIADGYQPVTPPDPKVQKEFDQAGLSLTPKPTDYQNIDLYQLRERIEPDRFSNVIETATHMAADMGLSRDMGKAVIEQIADLGQKLAKMNPEEKQSWIIQQEELGAKRWGPQTYKAMKEKAAQVLQLSKPYKTSRGNIENLAGAIRDGAVGKSWWLVSTLANHADTLAALNSRLAAKGLKR